MPNYTRLTLGELLAHDNTTVQRNAMSILKTLQRKQNAFCKIHNDEYTERHKLDGHYICRACIVDKVTQTPNTVTPHGQ